MGGGIVCFHAAELRPPVRIFQAACRSGRRNRPGSLDLNAPNFFRRESDGGRYRNLVTSCFESGQSRSTKVREAMMFKRIDHIEIVTDQLDRTVQFYTEVLGFTVRARDRIESSGLGVPIDLVYLDLGGTVVELISYEGGTVDPAPQTEHLGYA